MLAITIASAVLGAPAHPGGLRAAIEPLDLPTHGMTLLESPPKQAEDDLVHNILDEVDGKAPRWWRARKLPFHAEHSEMARAAAASSEGSQERQVGAAFAMRAGGGLQSNKCPALPHHAIGPMVVALAHTQNCPLFCHACADSRDRSCRCGKGHW